MAIPSLQYRKDILVMVAWDAATPAVHVPWCGATGISLSIANAVNEIQVGDCTDWSLPVQTVRAYGAQSVTATVNASLTRAGRDQLIRAMIAQRELPIRFHFVDAATAEIEYIDGVGLLPQLDIENIGSVEEGAAISYTLNISFKNGVTLTNKV